MSGTGRQALRELLERESLELRQMSAALGRSERDLVDDLAHLEKSLRSEDARLHIEPSECLVCGFRFDGRRRFKRPGRCPECRSTRLSYPRFSIVS